MKKTLEKGAGVYLSALSTAMLVLAAISLALEKEWLSVASLPLAYGTYMKVIGFASLLAAPTALLPGGRLRWIFPLLFAGDAYLILWVNHGVAITYPASPMAQTSFDMLTVTLALGSCQLGHKSAGYWKPADG